MELDDLYKIFADIEDAQAARLNQCQADIMAVIAADKAEQKKAIANLSAAIAELSRKLDRLPSQSTSPPIVNTLEKMEANTKKCYEWVVFYGDKMTRYGGVMMAALVLLAGFSLFQFLSLPERTADKFYDTFYAAKAAQTWGTVRIPS